jgi:CheY-like chemotaxis protein
MARVLILDPDPESRNLLELYLARLGHETVRPRDPAGGGTEPDLVVLESASPAALREAEAVRSRLADVPIILISNEVPSPETSSLAPAAYLRKPARSHLLEWAIAGALEPAARLVAVGV